MHDDSSGNLTNAVASQCKVHGKGIETAIARKVARFTIDSFDAEGKRCTTGGEKFAVTLTGSSIVRARVFDKEDGSYNVEYKTNNSGTYSISILLHGASLPGSPFEVKVLMPRPDATQCLVRGDALRKAAARESMAFEIGFVDAHGQPTHAEEIDLHVEPILDDDYEDDSLERLQATAAEETARRWALEWAILRAASIWNMPPEKLHALVEGERTASLAADEAAKSETELASSPASDPDPLNDPPTPGRETPMSQRPGPSDQTANSEALTPGREDAFDKKVGEDEQAPDETNAPPSASNTRSSFEPPLYKPVLIRAVSGPLSRPLLVRLDSALDSELTGSIAVGSQLHILETRKASDGSLRAFVLVDEQNVARPRSPRARTLPTAMPTAPPESWLQEGEWPQPQEDPDLFDGGMEALLTGRASSRTMDMMSARDSMSWGGSSTLTQRSPRPNMLKKVTFRRKRTVGEKAARAESPTELVHSLVDDILAATHGWVTAVKDGRELITRPHEQLNSGQRRRDMSLWEQRKAADRLMQKSGTEAKNRTHGKMSEGQQAELIAGPSFAHELVSDPDGIGFAFGGVDPGTLHAHGQVIKMHTVRYSLGLAGRYRLHVGLRQQSVALPNSPFLLVVTPSAAHARSSHLPKEALPLQGAVSSTGEEAGCSMAVRLSDRMGNHCTSGGAVLKCKTELHGKIAGHGELAPVSQDVLDLEDGTYKISWQSQVSGTYLVSVTIAGVHLVGSPLDLLLVPGPPDVEKCYTEGDGLSSATAGRPSQLYLFCKDKYDNVANRSSSISFGLVLLPRDSKDVVMGKEGEEVKLRGLDGVLASLDSMSFDVSWSNEQEGYDIKYTAQEAGEFGLHVWLDAEGDKRKFIKGSPFAVRVSGVRASAEGSLLYGTDAYKQASTVDISEGVAAPSSPTADSPKGVDGLQSTPPLLRSASRRSSLMPNVNLACITAGEQLQLWPRLHDEFGNASFAAEGELHATVIQPEGKVELTLKQLRELGRYELNYEPQKKGRYTLHVDLNGEDIRESPFVFDVTPSAPVASKCKLHAPEQSPIVHSQCDLTLETVDKYGNRLDVGGAPIAARVVGQGVSAVEVHDRSDGTYILSFTGAVAGECRMVVRLENTEMKPMTVSFVAADEAQQPPAAGAVKA